MSNISLAADLDSNYLSNESIPIWLEDLACHGNESYIGFCPSRGWGSHDCTHALDAAVKCSSE